MLICIIFVLFVWVVFEGTDKPPILLLVRTWWKIFMNKDTPRLKTESWRPLHFYSFDSIVSQCPPCHQWHSRLGDSHHFADKDCQTSDEMSSTLQLYVTLQDCVLIILRIYYHYAPENLTSVIFLKLRITGGFILAAMHFILHPHPQQTIPSSVIWLDSSDSFVHQAPWLAVTWLVSIWDEGVLCVSASVCALYICTILLHS